jgi:hypothetical protein
MVDDSMWTKKGRGGSYAGWKKERHAPSSYAVTSQQKKVRDAGRDVGATCKGKKGSAFKECRSDVMRKHFG